MTEDGENEQLKLLGSPEHVKATGLLNDPDCVDTVTVRAPVPPTLTLIEEGFACNFKLPVVGVVPPQFKFSCTGLDI